MWGGDDPCDRKPMVWNDLVYESEQAHPHGTARETDTVAFDHELFAFYRDIIGLPLVREEASSVVFEFGDKRLWLDAVGHFSQAEIWLEIQSDDIEAEVRRLEALGYVD